MHGCNAAAHHYTTGITVNSDRIHNTLSQQDLTLVVFMYRSVSLQNNVFRKDSCCMDVMLLLIIIQLRSQWFQTEFTIHHHSRIWLLWSSYIDALSVSLQNNVFREESCMEVMLLLIIMWLMNLTLQQDLTALVLKMHVSKIYWGQGHVVWIDASTLTEMPNERAQH